LPTYPLATLGPTIDSSGISVPTFNDILQSLIATAQSIFGSDIYLTPDTQDYQLLAAVAMAINDANQQIVATYNGFLPNYAQGAGLSALVKINGLVRESPTNSTALVTIAGVVGTTINNGVVQDGNGNKWSLPSSVVIPLSGAITVTATCQTAGAIAAPANSISQIVTVIQGWQSVTNPDAATPGAPVETDAALRQRQAQSTAISSITPLEAILSAVANVAGVERYAIYENPTGTTDGNGVPPHSIGVVVEGGSATAIAQVIEQTKSPGTGTYGTTSEIVEDPAGLPITINFFELVNVSIYVAVTIQPLQGYVDQDGTDLINAIVNFINSLAIGEDVFYNWIIAAASQISLAEGQTYYVTALYIGTSPSPSGTANITIPFNEAAASVAANVTLTVL